MYFAADSKCMYIGLLASITEECVTEASFVSCQECSL